MGVATFTPTSPVEIVSSLAQFLEDEGWTVDLNAESLFSYSTSYVPTAGRRLHVHKDELHAELFGFVGNSKLRSYYPISYRSNAVGLAVATGLDAGANWDKQPGACLATNGNGLGPILNNVADGGALHVYAWEDTPAVALVLEISAGVFQWLVWGRITPFGVLAGGEFMTGSYNDYGLDVGPFVQGYDVSSGTYQACFLRSDLGGAYPFAWFLPTAYGAERRSRWPLGNALQYPPYANTTGQAYAHQMTLNGLLGGLPSSFLGLSPLLPLPVLAETGTGTDLWMPMGTIPNIRYVDMTNLLAGEEIVLGTDTWVCWPLASRTESDPRGLAVLVEV
ncbi:MAG: hypothetical protein AB7D57_01730 [Desulfovibrionaceae bacterium]